MGKAKDQYKSSTEPTKSFTKPTKEIMQHVLGLAGMWPVIVLLILGLGMIIPAVVLKLVLPVESFSSLEFIVTALAGTLLIILGILLRLYQYKTVQEIQKGIRAVSDRAAQADLRKLEININKEIKLEEMKQEIKLEEMKQEIKLKGMEQPEQAVE